MWDKGEDKEKEKLITLKLVVQSTITAKVIEIKFLTQLNFSLKCIEKKSNFLN